MHQKPPYKLFMRKNDHASGVPRLSGPGRERNFCIGDREKPAVGDGNLVGISAKIFDRIAEAIECLLDKRTPVFEVKGVAERIPLKRMCKLPAVIRKRKAAGVVSIIERSKELSLKLVPKYINRDKEAVAGLTQLIIFGQSAAGYDAVHMHVIVQLLVPCVKDLNDGGESAEVFRISRQFKERSCAAAVKHAVKKLLVGIQETVQLMRKSEYDMEIR